MNNITKLSIMVLMTAIISSTAAFSQLSPPTGLTVTSVTQTRINLSWNTVTGATNYTIYQDGSAIQMITGSSYSAAVSSGTTHSYYVKAGNPGGMSGASNTVSGTAIPATPTYLTATPVPNAQVSLSWPGVSGATFYTVIGFYGESHTTTGTSYTFSGQPCGQNITYSVTASNAGGTSGSASASAMTICIYTVTFNANTGSGSMSPQTGNYNTPAALTTNTFTKTGYTFAGWNTAANGTGTSYANGASYPFTASITLYAQWTIIPYTVTFNANTGSGSMSPQTGNYNTPAALTTNTFTKTGYTFAGWNTAANGTGTSYANGASYPFTASITLYAQWTIIPYTVTFNANTGSGSMSPQTGNYNTPAALTTNTFTKTGYTFAGWNTAANGTGTSYANGASYPFTASITLYAQWTIIPYTVTFNANTGSGSMSPQTGNYNTPAALTTNTFTKTGYTFAGWNTAANGTGTSYANGASYPFTASITLYAQWTIIPYTVTFNANTGSGSMSPQTGNYNTPAALTTNTFTKTGYTFAGWNTAANGTGTSYANGASYPFTASITLYAQWTIIPYTVTFNANTGSGSMSPQTGNYNTPAALTTNTFTKTGYTFAGWNTAANGTGTSYANGASYPFTASITLYAQWTIIPYTVTFNANTGSGSMSPQTGNYNTPAALTTNTFTKTGYTFAGWNTAANGTGTSYANGASYPFTANITLYAQWTIPSPTISISPTSLNVGYTGGPVSFTVSNSGGGTLKWSALSNTTWMSISGLASGTNTGTVTVNYHINTCPTARSGIITVSAAGAVNTPQSVEIIQQAFPPQPPPFFWRGVFLVGMDVASDKSRFFNTLKDNLNLNVYQVSTFDGAFLRHPFYLNNNVGLNIITQMDSLAYFASYAGLRLTELTNGNYNSFIKREIDTILSFTGSNHFRFYLKDEPEYGMNSPWKYVRDYIVDSSGLTIPRNGSVTAYCKFGTYIQQFLLEAQPSELIIDAYFLNNGIPHPSLEGNNDASIQAGIMPWDYDYYFACLQITLNEALTNQIRPAAEAANYYYSFPNSPYSSPVPLILVPQLHGMMFKKTQKYDRDNVVDSSAYLRPPSPSEIKLQFNIGIAYGVKGFLAYPYGTEIVWDQSFYNDSLAFPGLVPQVSRDATLTVHSSNYGFIFEKTIYTGYQEKWEALSSLYRRLKTNNLEETLLALSWVGAKSWTMTPGWIYDTVHTQHWEYIVPTCTATTPSGRCNNLPQVEIGHLKLLSTATDYIVVVNRRCANTDTATISVTLKSGCTWQVTDIENSSHTWTVIGGHTFTDTFEPGEGKIYRIERPPHLLKEKEKPTEAISNTPTAYGLSQNYPNPFNPSTTIRYDLPTGSRVKIQIFNMLGQLVKELINTQQDAGYQSVTWNAQVASGMYFYKLEAFDVSNPSNRFVNTKKMILLK